MKHSIYIDQLVLEFWKGKIDVTDCLILSFIADLNPQDETLKKYMYKGHFLITRHWLLDELPMLQIGAQALYKRLKKLRELGIITVLHKTVTGNKQLAFYRMSKLYYKISRMRHIKATEAARGIKAVAEPEDEKAVIPGDHGQEESHSISVSKPSSPETMKPSIKDEVTYSQPGGAFGAPPAEVGEEDVEEVSDREIHANLLKLHSKLGNQRRVNEEKAWLKENAPEILEAFGVGAA